MNQAETMRARLGRFLAHRRFRDESGGRVRLGTLLLLRWVAILGQIAAILLVHFAFGFALPLGPALGIVGVSVLINFAASSLLSPATRLSDWGAALSLGYDVVQLALLLALTGGLENPFAILFVVPVTISATMLRLVSTATLCALVIACVSVIALVHGPLPWDGRPPHMPGLYVVGTWAALVMGTLFLAAYAWRVAAEARRMADALSATQLALDQEQRVAELGALAAAAAHELGTPLGTIAIVAKEISRGLDPASPIADDVALLVSQTVRCREILARLSRGGQGAHKLPLSRLPAVALVGMIADPYRSEKIDIVIDAAPEETTPSSPEPEMSVRPETLHGLGNLIENAVQFAGRRVDLRLRWNSGELRLEILDDGPGFARGMLAWLGEPYLSSRREAGRMGLGVFISKMLLRRTGAHVAFSNRHRRIGGARVVISWPRASLVSGQATFRPESEPVGGEREYGG